MFFYLNSFIQFVKNILMLNDNIPNIGNKLGGGSKGAVHELLNNIYSVVKIGSMNKFERLLYEFLKHYMLYNLSQEQNKQELRNLITKPEKIIIGFNKFRLYMERIFPNDMQNDSDMQNVKKGESLYNVLKDIRLIKLNKKARTIALANILIKIADVLLIIQKHCKFIHNDMIVGNIMVDIDYNPDENGNIKIINIYIIDFELAQIILKNNIYLIIKNREINFNILFEDNKYWKIIDMFFIIYQIFYRYYYKLVQYKEIKTNNFNCEIETKENNKSCLDKIVPELLRSYVREKILGLNKDFDLFISSYQLLSSYHQKYRSQFFHYYFIDKNFFIDFFNKIEKKYKLLSIDEIINNLTPTNIKSIINELIKDI